MDSKIKFGIIYGLNAYMQEFDEEQAVLASKVAESKGFSFWV